MNTGLPVNLGDSPVLVNVNHLLPRRKGSWLSVLMFQVSPVGAAEGSAVSGAACVPGWVSVWVCGGVCEPQGPVQHRAPSPRAAGGGGHVKHPITCSTKET